MPTRRSAVSTRTPPPPPLRNGRSFAMHMFSSLTILLILSANKNNGKSMVLCDAAAEAIASSLVLPPTPAIFLSRSSGGRSVSVSAGNVHISNNIDAHNNAAAATAAALLATSSTSQIVNLTRQHGGDVFDAMGKSHIYIFHCNQFGDNVILLGKKTHQNIIMAIRHFGS